MSNVTRTAKGFQVDLGEGHVANIGPNFTHVALYSTGGWRTGQICDLPCFSKHKSAAAAMKTARDHVAYDGGTFEIVDLVALP